jgi:hypothetical protein
MPWMQGMTSGAETIPALQNPMSVDYLKQNLRKSQPRLVFNADLEARFRDRLKRDPVLQNMVKAIRLNAADIQTRPLLTRKMEGRRLLGTSRDMLWRMNMLGFMYLLEKDPTVLKRIDKEVTTVCGFSDWNPSHYLDVAEMSMAVAFALDWTAGQLPKTTIDLAQRTLIDKGIKPSWPDNGRAPWWAFGTNNWNQVCNGGMIAASIAIAEVEPELAARTIHRALEGMPHALVEYGPDGVYPEGSTYWGYGTSFSVVTAAMLESAFDTDFGLADYPAFKASAVFRALSIAPSGWYYNFADCGDKRDDNGDVTLAWFAAKTGNATFFETDRFLRPAGDMGQLSRLAGAAMMWLSQYEGKDEETLPTAWKGEGANPIVIFTGGPDDPHQYYFGGKGGRGRVNHGNMDGGSFVFELNGVRWVIDPGNQSYNALERTGFNLWGSDQDAERWTLLTKNNYGHSTLTVNDALHRTDGLVTLSSFKAGPRPEATFDMSPTLAGQVASASRRFVKDGPMSLLIEDDVTLSDATETITWQLMTTADVRIVEGGAVLIQDGKSLRLHNLSHPDIIVSVVSLYPPPLALDRRIEDLKRLDIRIPADTVEGRRTAIKVRLVANER